MTLAAPSAPPGAADAFYASDAAWDGRFVAGVRTTGIFCRPSCRVRKPLAHNVVYLADVATARAAGYRACLRCHPEAGTRVHVRRIDTAVGPMLLGATEHAVVLADFAERAMIPVQLAAIRRRIGPLADGDAGRAEVLDALEAQLREYLAGDRTEFDLPLDAPGSAFQERVWRELARIPYGATISYRELADRVGAPAASRAVGRANGSNRVALIIPCHRVVAANGGLGGYGGGLAAKRLLLDLEARVGRQPSTRAPEISVPMA
jgi:AraC family transcriptional regulator, regulatory protein of adaptative response / methylated-DNA-[protein]-cysteine methyltransferase